MNSLLNQITQLEQRLANAPMTCEQFYEHYMEDKIDSEMQEMYWGDSYSSDKLFDSLKHEAKRRNIPLEDVDSWDYDKFFWNVWRNTEKGLS